MSVNQLICVVVIATQIKNQKRVFHQDTNLVVIGRELHRHEASLVLVELQAVPESVLLLTDFDVILAPEVAGAVIDVDDVRLCVVHVLNVDSWSSNFLRNRLLARKAWNGKQILLARQGGESPLVSVVQDAPARLQQGSLCVTAL